VYAINGYVLGIDPETFEYKWEMVSDVQEFLLEVTEDEVYKVHFATKTDIPMELDAELLDNTLDVSLKIPTSEEDATALEVEYKKDTNKTKEAIQNEGALNLTQENNEEVKTEIEKIKTNLTNLGLFAL